MLILCFFHVLVRSRVLLSVEEGDEVDFAPTPSIMDAMAAYLKPAPTITVVDNDTNKYVAMETSSAQAKPQEGLASAS